MNTKVYCANCKENRSAKKITAYKCNYCGVVQTEDQLKLKKEDRNLEEIFADLCHKQWTGWMEYLFAKTKKTPMGLLITKEDAERWMRQMATDYKNLPDSEQSSDRIEARKFIEILSKF